MIIFIRYVVFLEIDKIYIKKPTKMDTDIRIRTTKRRYVLKAPQHNFVSSICISFNNENECVEHKSALKHHKTVFLFWVETPPNATQIQKYKNQVCYI